MTQRDRVFAALLAAGTRGITQLDFADRPGNGGKPIRRLASRINELRARGHVIHSAVGRHRMAVYRLVAPASPGGPAARLPARQPGPPGSSDQQATLFDPVDLFGAAA